jgi:hypothetical protein
MRSRAPRLLSLLLLASLAGRVEAQEIPCTDGPCLRPVPAGTHFLAELGGGGSFGGRSGFIVGGLFGVGGQLRRFPLPLYAISEVAYATSTVVGEGSPLPFRDERAHRELTLGLRLYVPIVGPLRLFVEALGGAGYVSASLERADLPSLAASGWVKLATVGGGVQLRLLHHLSLGVRARAVLTDDDLGDLRALSGAQSVRRVSVLAGMTWHF